MRQIFIIALLLSKSIVYSQKIENDSIINKFKREITSFYINEKILDKSIVNNSLDHVYATEFKTQAMLGYNTIGIYRIGAFISHSQEHILIKENMKFEIFHIQNIEVVLTKILEFSKNNKLSPDNMLIYIKRAIQMYDESK